MNDYSQLEERLNYTFQNKQLIIEALTHKSDKKPYNNERLEFLGDAVLDLIVGEYLFSKFPNSNEGILSKIRASLVNESGFTLLARKLDLGSYIYLSLAEENNNGRPWFNEQRRREQTHMVEEVGANLRQMMPFIDPVTIRPGD